MKSKQLARIVGLRQRYGYDLIVYVGLARYLRGKQREEIRTELLRERNIDLSSGTVSNLCDRFLIYLEALHLDRSPSLRAVIQEYGYPLHIDATSEYGKGGLFVCMDGVRKWVLMAGKIPSESEEHLKSFVECTVDLFGDPLATVRDMGEAGKNAIASLGKRGVMDLICHYHFLGAIGRKLFDNPYALLRNILKQSRVRPDLRRLLKDLRQYQKTGATDRRFGSGQVRENLSALALWIIEGDGKKDAPYPFSLPHLEFLKRCREVMQRADGWVTTPRSQAERRALRHLESLIRRLDRDKRFADAMDQLEKGWQAFCELRNVLRLTDAELPRGDERYKQTNLPDREAKRLKEIEKATQRYIDNLRQDIGKKNIVKLNSPGAIIFKYFGRYGDNLFGHPVIRDDNGSIIAAVDRTNNVPEHFFGGEKQHLRRRLGRANLGRDLEDQPAQAAYAANLRQPDYVRVLCGSIENLPSAFADLDEQALSRSSPLIRSNRDSALQRRVRTLLEHGDTPSLDEIEPNSVQISL